MTQITELHRAALRQFRARQKTMGENPGKAAARFRQQRQALTAALKAGPATVPQLAQATGLPPHEVLWHLTGLRKYGIARETDQEGDYPRYALTAAPTATPDQT